MSIISIPIPDDIFFEGLERWLVQNIESNIESDDLLSARAFIVILINLKIKTFVPEMQFEHVTQDQRSSDQYEKLTTFNFKNLCQYVMSIEHGSALTQLLTSIQADFENVLLQHDHKTIKSSDMIDLTQAVSFLHI